MPDNIINLNKFKKNKKREEKEQSAQENRVFFGQTKLERTKLKKEKEKLNSLIEGAKLDPTEE